MHAKRDLLKRLKEDGPRHVLARWVLPREPRRPDGASVGVENMVALGANHDKTPHKGKSGQNKTVRNTLTIELHIFWCKCRDGSSSQWYSRHGTHFVTEFHGPDWVMRSMFCRVELALISHEPKTSGGCDSVVDWWNSCYACHAPHIYGDDVTPWAPS